MMRLPTGCAPAAERVALPPLARKVRIIGVPGSTWVARDDAAVCEPTPSFHAQSSSPSSIVGEDDFHIHIQQLINGAFS